jgi:hypothetical protein
MNKPTFTAGLTDRSGVHLTLFIKDVLEEWERNKFNWITVDLPDEDSEVDYSSFRALVIDIGPKMNDDCERALTTFFEDHPRLDDGPVTTKYIRRLIIRGFVKYIDIANETANMNVINNNAKSARIKK